MQLMIFLLTSSEMCYFTCVQKSIYLWAILKTKKKNVAKTFWIKMNSSSVDEMLNWLEQIILKCVWDVWKKNLFKFLNMFGNERTKAQVGYS